MKYIIKKDTPYNRAVSKAKKRRIQYTFGSLITFITILAFFVNSPVVQFHPNELKDFSLSSDASAFRTGKPVPFTWSLMGPPQKLILVFGDGSFEELSSECFNDNGMTYGSIDHIYALQGKYTPILKAYYPGETFKKVLDVYIRNEAPLFSFGFNGEIPNPKGVLRTSASPFQTFEDEEVDITINVTNNPTNDTLTYQFNFGDSQVVIENNSITHAWKNKGSYPVTITVVGAQGELSTQTQYIDVLNRRPKASFRIMNEDDVAVGKEIELTAEDSFDSLSDINNLRYIWDYGDGLMDYGKSVSHTFYESGSYNITLIVKDDDSFVDQMSRIIVIENIKPDIAIVGDLYNSSLIINEGEEILFSTSSRDDDPDIFKLFYYWNFDSVEFDPLSLDNYQLGGWKNKHVFEDDFEGNVTVGVIDSSNEFNSDSINVQALNVAPQIGVLSASIISNVSFEVYRSDTTKEGNFTFVLFKDNKTSATKFLSFLNSSETYLSTNPLTASFSLDNQWKVAINSSEILPADSVFQASVKLTFINGQELILNSDQMMGGSYGSWEVDLSSEFFDEQNFSYKYPMTFATQVFDPSKDEVHYSVSYQENKLLEITCLDALPILDAFTTQDTEYIVDVYEQDSKQFANITARKDVYSELFENHTFPFIEEVQIDIAPLININNILQGRLGLSDLSVENCLLAENTLIANAVDDDLGEDTLTFGFESLVDIKLTQDYVPLTPLISSNAIPVPFGKIGGFSSTAYEGERVKFTSKTNDQDVPGMVFMWDFGDGTVAYSEHAKHAWLDAGVYNITLAIADPYGNIHRDQKNITILSKAPEIVGPFAFQGSEGSSIVLDVEIYDSNKDELKLEYFWYDDKGTLVSQEQKPVFNLDDGTYTYTLEVVDPSGMRSSKEIVVTMHSLSPEIYMSNYMYHGVVGDYSFENDGELELKVYGMDTLLDSEKLYFFWTIRNGKKVVRLGDDRYQLHSTVTFTCRETTTYQGEVRVCDPEGNEKVCTFQIVSTIDSSLDGVDDNTEEMLRTSDDPTDTDGDGLTDTYEMTVSNTSYLDPDTDGDLLWDGQTVNGSVGELAVSTDPLDWDTDDDFLSDGTEYIGWNITVVYFENTTNFHITSDSLESDTDDDGLSDYEEYYAGSHPRQADTDNDDLTDDIDPFPANWDGDNDLLSDFEEIARGTDYNNTDSDQDGLKDGEEVYGWGIGFFTNPLEADTDHDHISDSAEIKNYLVKLQDDGFDDLDKKVNLSAPISLHFPHHFEQAVAAQISFGISFGEYGQNATDSYGVPDEDVQDLYVVITKKDDGVLLANFSTNNTRYFSQVVDVTPIMNDESLGLDYWGDYKIGIGVPGGTTQKEGEYKGTYSFATEDDGETGTDIDFINECHQGTDCHAKIISQKWGHKKVLELKDQSYDTGGDYVSVYNYFDSAQTSGTVEYWMTVNTPYYYSQVLLYSGSSVGLVVAMGLNYFRYNDGSWHNIRSATANQFYHVRIDFECGSGGYEGLSADTFYVYIDGTKYGPYNYQNSLGSCDRLRMLSSGYDGPYYAHYDAFGYSWDPSYAIGDNKEEENYDYKYQTDGAYQGTYSFEDDAIGGDPDNWEVYEGTGSTVSVLGSLGNHNQIVEIATTTAGSGHLANTWNNFDDQEYGSVELWFRSSNVNWNHANYIFLRHGSAVGLLLNAQDDKWKYYSGGSFDVPNVPIPLDNVWQHILIHFECSTGGYMGLGQHQFEIIINGISSGSIGGYSPQAHFDNFYVSPSGWHANYKVNFDAVGYSWDPDYDIGDNLVDPLEAGCYLDYFELEFCRYLDPNDPDSDDDGILDGVEMGVLVEGTDLIDFEDYYLSNNLTQNAIGNFSATYSFEEEADGTTNANISFIDYVSVDSSCVATIVKEFEYHNKVLELSDENSGGKVYAYNTAFERQNGTIEFWWAQTADDQDSLVRLYDDGTGTALTLYMRDTGKFAWYDGTYHDVGKYDENTWYHHKIAFNCSDGAKGTFTWFIDGTLEAEDIDFDDNCQSLDKLMFGTDSGSSGYDTYLDAIGFTWNWTYWEGENYENQLPSDPKIGHYPGTYSFEDDTVGGLPAGWVSYEGDYCDVEVLASLDGHDKVVELYDHYADTTCYASMYNEFTPVDDGTIEVWLRYDGVAESRFMQIFEDDSMTVGMHALHSSGGNFYDGNGNLLQVCNNNQWYHVKFEFDCSADTFSIWIDGVLKTDTGEMPANFDDDVGVLRFVTYGWGTYNAYWMYVDGIGFSWDSDYEIGDNNNSQEMELTAPDEYYLEIPHIGKVTDGQLDLEVKSDSSTEGSGRVFVQLIKEEMNLTKSDIVLLAYCKEFDSSEQFTYQKSIDLSPYVTSGQVYGTYHLRVQAFSTASTDVFNLTKFEIETDTYVVADFNDTIAWVTDPAEEDTDGDGWSDNYEIFTKGTSPVSVDSDGDESWDPNDRDPLRDVMLEIHPYKGIFRNLAILDLHALLQISVAFTFGENEYYIVTPVAQGTEYANGFGYYQTAYFGDHYYINIDDDTVRQSNTITMHLQMWHVRRHRGLSDVEIIDGNDDYSIGTPSETYTTVYANQTGYFGHLNELEVKVKTVAIEKANTLAIFNANTTFNGHYNDPNQRYTLIQLTIPDEGHYLGSESFLNEEIGNNCTNIDFVSFDCSDVESYVKIIEEIDGHSNVLRVQGGLDDHADFDHNFTSSQAYGTIEWWWRTSKISGGVSYFYLENDDTEVIRLFMRDGKIKYHDGSYHDVMSASSDTWYRMKLFFECKVGEAGLYRFDLYVDGVLKVIDAPFYNDEDSINKLKIATTGDPFYSYFDAFGYSWDANYDIGDNGLTYSVEGTPFEHGMNVIVVPTELFTHTKLNGYVENDTLDLTPLYHPDEHVFEFTAIARDGNPDTANSDVDFLFTRLGISPEDAMDVLELILWGCVNDTLDESNNTIYEKIHDYVSTKINGTMASEMGLPYSVLGYIPWFNTYTSSAMGDEPEPEGGITDMLLWLMCLINPILYIMLHAQMAMTRGTFYQYLVNFAANIFMAILTALGDLLWLIARAALYVLFWIMLAIEFLFITITVLTIGVSFLAFSFLGDIESSFGISFPLEYGKNHLAGYIELSSPNNKIRTEYWIEWMYWEFFDLYVPWVVDKSISGDTVVYEQSQDILSGETLESTGQNTVPTLPATEDTPPTLHCGFIDKGAGSYEFWTNYYDPNHKAPDISYGVKLHLIDSSGNALNSYDMVESEDPDYSILAGVNFTKTVDLSSYDEGLWHYYFSTKDKDTAEIVTQPINDYFVGPDTSEGPTYLMGHRVTSDDTNDYSNLNGWITDDFRFYVTWWNTVDGNAPVEINLCLVPSQISIGTGVSKTVGIQKFEMSEVESSPDYDDPVEYYVDINFDNLNYDDDTIGAFKYYFEAESSTGEIISTLSSDDEDPDHLTHFEGPYVKSVSQDTLNFGVNSYCTYGEGSIISRDVEVVYIVEVSDYSNYGLSSKPVIIFSQGETTEEFDMLHYRSSTDGKTKNYYFKVDCKTLSTGTWQVDFEFEYDEDPYSIDSGILLVSDYIKEFTIEDSAFYDYADIFRNIGFFVTGTLTLGLFVATIISSMASKAHADTIAIVGSIISLVSVILSIALTIGGLVATGNKGGLIGFAMSLLINFILVGLMELTSFSKFYKVGIKLDKLLSVFRRNIEVFVVLQAVILVSGNFLHAIGQTTGYILLNGISDILLLFPVFLSTIVSSAVVSFALSAQRHLHPGSSAQKVIIRTMRIYWMTLFAGAVAGFILADFI